MANSNSTNYFVSGKGMSTNEVATSYHGLPGSFMLFYICELIDAIIYMYLPRASYLTRT